MAKLNENITAIRALSKRRNLQASTLVETLIAIVIISLVFGIALTLLMNLQTTGNSSEKLRAFLTLQKVVPRLISENNGKDAELLEDGFKILLETKRDSRGDGISLLQLKVMNASTGKVIMQRNEILDDGFRIAEKTFEE